ncbi:MAG TPA: hypothetical protein VF983_00600 [Streptosporangiaceae bacterium]
MKNMSALPVMVRFSRVAPGQRVLGQVYAVGGCSAVTPACAAHTTLRGGRDTAGAIQYPAPSPLAEARRDGDRSGSTRRTPSPPGA